MRFKSRSAVAAALAVAAFLMAAATASAVTVSPAGTYTATSGVTTLRLASNGQTLTCSTSSIVASISASGAGAIAGPTPGPAGATYTRCTNPLLGTFTVVQNADWTLGVSTSGSNALLTVNVPVGGATITGPGCTFTVGGTVVLTAASLTVTPSTPAPVTSSSLTIDGNNGGSLCGLFPRGLRATYGGTYNLDRTATVTP